MPNGTSKPNPVSASPPATRHEAGRAAADELGRDREIDPDPYPELADNRPPPLDKTAESITAWAEGLSTGEDMEAFVDSLDGEGGGR